MVEFGFKDYSYKFDIKELPNIKELPETDSNGNTVPKDIREKIIVRVKDYRPRVRKTDGKKNYMD